MANSCTLPFTIYKHVYEYGILLLIDR